MLALHPADSDVVLVGFPRTFLQEERKVAKHFDVFVRVCVCFFRQNESHLAVKHLITGHVVQLDSVQVISAERHQRFVHRMHVPRKQDKHLQFKINMSVNPNDNPSQTSCLRCVSAS